MANALPPAPSFRWRWLLPVVVLVAAVQWTPLGAIADRAFYDAASRHPFRALPVPPGSALVMIDSKTLDAFSTQGLGSAWPPPRAAFAALIAGLERAGARKIVLDFIFLDRSAAEEQDNFLGSLAAAVPGVVLARTARQTPVFWDAAFVAANATCFSHARTGIADGTPDADGVLRHYNADRSLAAGALDAPPRDRGGLLRWHGGLAELSRSPNVAVLSGARFVVAGLPIVSRLSESGAILSPAEMAKALAAEPALTGPGFDDVRGKVVFVGANAEGTFDQKPFAIGGLEPGVLAHWTAWANLSSSGFIQPLPWYVPAAGAAAIIGLLAWFGMRGSSIVGALLVGSLAVLAVFAVAYAGLAQGWFLAPSVPVAGASFGLLGVLAENFLSERRRRREVQAIFGSYVAPDFVDLLVRDPSAIRLGGERRDASVFFCDLAGFTDLSEQVSPEQLLAMVNGYLQETSDCLMEHGAYIDKYIGDAVMAVFGVPLPMKDHAIAACRAALAAQQRLTERNVELQQSYGRSLAMRIGINSGEMIVGNLGSDRKKNYTVLGDVVNLASRLEGANKEFGTSILLGAATAALVQDQMLVRPLTALRVKGKQAAVVVFELVGERERVSPAQAAFLDAYNEGHALFSSRNFSAAASAFEGAATLRPDDRMTATLLADARRFSVEAPPAEWQPILSLTSK